MADPSNMKKEKEIHLKGQSRVQKICHWCTKAQEPGKPPFQACAKCKEVIYCSRECQVKSWPLHKGICKITADSRKKMDDTGKTQQVAAFKKWHGSHVVLLRQAIICALDLAHHPDNADKKVIFLSVELKEGHARLSSEKKYYAVGGFDMTRDEATSMLSTAGGAAILESNWKSHEHMKKKGGLGVSPVILKAGDVVDIVNITLPSHAGAKAAVASKDMDWGEEWVNGFNIALELGYVTGKAGE